MKRVRREAFSFCFKGGNKDMDYKDTLLMPKTKFEMRGKLPSKEPGFQKRWLDARIYEKMLAKGLAPMYTATIYDNDFDYIGKTLDICPDICVAGGATSNGEWIRKRYCEVYEKTGRKARIHALGFVKNPDMFRLPIVSVDSSSFNCGRRYGYFSYFSLSEKKVKVVPKTSMNFPIEARLKFIECGMTPEILKKYDTSGANAIELSGIVAYTEYQMYCYANKRELFISVPNAEQLEQIVWVYNNLGNIDYLEYRKRFRK